MISLGIDPGYKRVGYGVIKSWKGNLHLIQAGLLKIESQENPEIALEVRSEIKKLILKFKPAAAALEKVYFSKNRKTAIRVAEMRGIITLALKEEGLPLYEFSPNEVKSQITGYGFSDKISVAKMVKLILKEPEIKVGDDAFDALALAILAVRKSLL